MPLTFQEAQHVIEGAHRHAASRGWRVTVAVVDEGGLLTALGRMDGAFPLSSQIAEAKAAGAALWHRDGGALQGLQAERPAFFAAVSAMTRGRLVPAQGSLLIRRGDQILGAVGVSGAASEEDRQCAEAGLALLPD